MKCLQILRNILIFLRLSLSAVYWPLVWLLKSEKVANVVWQEAIVMTRVGRLQHLIWLPRLMLRLMTSLPTARQLTRRHLLCRFLQGLTPDHQLQSPSMHLNQPSQPFWFTTLRLHHHDQAQHHLSKSQILSVQHPHLTVHRLPLTVLHLHTVRPHHMALHPLTIATARNEAKLLLLCKSYCWIVLNKTNQKHYYKRSVSNS